ncbi:glycine zipper family protein [Aromatoleum sp.]|uniref:glycine zipper family protein n=1 Tax=Aromatoleum sp. TaxID=2307007 RepID=UPI002FCAC504
MKLRVGLCTGVVFVALAPVTVLAQEPIVYPAKGQSPEQQQKDDGECYVWAKNNTGVDPATPAAESSAPSRRGGERVRGAARGAVGGAAIGAIAGDTEKGAGVGAVMGTMAGGRQARQNQAGQQQAQNQGQQQLDAYHRAYQACMEGRGYTIR